MQSNKKITRSIKTLLALILITTVCVSCDNNDDEQTTPETPIDGFTYHPNNANSIFYETPNAYIEIDEDDDDAYPGAPDSYSFFFTNGRVYDNDLHVNGTSDEILLSVNSTNFAVLQIQAATHTSLQTGIPPAAGNTYTASSNDSNVITNFNVASSSPQTFINVGGSNVEFGEGIEAGANIHNPASIGNSITINAINIDTTNPSNSTIDVDYIFINTAGELISGHYEGTLGIFED